MAGLALDIELPEKLAIIFLILIYNIIASGQICKGLTWDLTAVRFLAVGEFTPPLTPSQG
jgi:hypothetical protein